MMKTLTIHDIENMELKAGYGEGPVTLDREDFEALVAEAKDNLIVRDEEDFDEGDDE